MSYEIIVDSCCDMTPELQEKLGATSIPLTLLLGDKEFTDDSSLDLNNFMSEMKQCLKKVGSACPSADSFKKAMEKAKNSFVVTLSSQLSGSYNSAVLAKSLAEENGGVDTHIFDSKSASAGEILIALKIREFLQNKNPKDFIVHKITQFIDNMKTYFVLENYDNLLKNGRLSKITGKLIRILNINLIMGSDGAGNIALYAKTRGVSQMINKMLSFIENSGKKTEDGNLVITHCNNLDLAKKLKSAIEDKFNFKEVIIIPTGGLSSLYADDKGVIMAF